MMTENKSLRQATWLAVDDDPTYLRLLKAYLEPDGYTLITATSGEQALTLIKDNNRPSIMGILLDCKLGDTDGLSLLRDLKSNEQLLDTPVIMITGMAEAEYIIEGIDAGVYYYMTKPISPIILRALVQNAMTEQRERRALIERTDALSIFHQIIDRYETSFKTLEDAHFLAPMLAQFFPDPQRVVNGIFEMMVNAVEHGNLELSHHDKSRLMVEGGWISEVNHRLSLPEYANRFVRAVFIRDRESVSLTITDMGPGFDWRPYLEFSTERAFDLHGRGIALSRALAFDHIEYRGNGNEVVLASSLSLWLSLSH